ncbi:MAG: TetR/AcrR family transcriptional regulator [Prolixibacteraceae bacterium]
MPRTPQQYEEIRTQKRKMIMDIALQLFANEGYHATSISKIAEKANISKGLLYNYFSSKEELLKTITETFSEEVTDMMNPDHDDNITLNEATHFIDLYFEMITSKPERIKMFYQLTMQPFVSELIAEMAVDPKSKKTHQLFMDFLNKNNNPYPAETYLTIISVMKGFGIQYVFAPQLYSKNLIDNFKSYLKEIIIQYKSEKTI